MAQIRQAPINVQNVVTYDVVVEVSNADLKLFPGMTANVKIVTGKAEHALRLPVAALRFHPATASPTAGTERSIQIRQASSFGCAGAANGLCSRPGETQARTCQVGTHRRELHRNTQAASPKAKQL